jgi:23S rRNA (cytosine1962-C5)-methyltransferase
MTVTNDYELLDAGEGRRLERFGRRVVDRPAPGAVDRRRFGPDRWSRADLRFDRDAGWSARDPNPDPDPERDPWTIAVDGITLELRPTAAGQLGVFPEHHLHWPWLRGAVAGREGRAAVLHLFASTGATTLALARAGADVTHVDGSRPTTAWARRNAELSDLAGAHIRWIVDDALTFTRREARRGRRYDGVILDPPSYGHAPSRARWTLADALPELLDAVATVAADDAFVLLTAHTTGVRADDLADALDDAFHGRGATESGDVELRATSGAVLPSGVAARMILR